MSSMQKWTLGLIWLIWYLFIKRKNVSRVGEKYEKSKAAEDIVIKDIKKLFPFNAVKEDLVLQDYFCFDTLESLTRNREKIINVSSDSKVETNSEFSKSLATNLSKEDLKKISNKQILTDNIINGLQKIFKKQFPDANNLQDPLLGQLFSYQLYQNAPFFQVVHNGLYH